ncbi:hypothetical protein DXG03_009648 [Asterophora parasitica]|uniref:Uncharacterized protein n=1 Tax=Asterophora parasitica TaxID=117018 RepID=A0A9P7KC46_9AGAR|nr:hypothetical protein DXG03_009648 [Asterophora parasitica]
MAYNHNMSSHLNLNFALRILSPTGASGNGVPRSFPAPHPQNTRGSPAPPPVSPATPVITPERLAKMAKSMFIPKRRTRPSEPPSSSSPSSSSPSPRVAPPSTPCVVAKLPSSSKPSTVPSKASGAPKPLAYPFNVAQAPSSHPRKGKAKATDMDVERKCLRSLVDGMADADPYLADTTPPKVKKSFVNRFVTTVRAITKTKDGLHQSTHVSDVVPKALAQMDIELLPHISNFEVDTIDEHDGDGEDEEIDGTYPQLEPALEDDLVALFSGLTIFDEMDGDVEIDVDMERAAFAVDEMNGDADIDVMERATPAAPAVADFDFDCPMPFRLKPVRLSKSGLAHAYPMSTHRKGRADSPPLAVLPFVAITASSPASSMETLVDESMECRVLQFGRSLRKKLKNITTTARRSNAGRVYAYPSAFRKTAAYSFPVSTLPFAIDAITASSPTSCMEMLFDEHMECRPSPELGRCIRKRSKNVRAPASRSKAGRVYSHPSTSSKSVAYSVALNVLPFAISPSPNSSPHNNDLSVAMDFCNPTIALANSPVSSTETLVDTVERKPSGIRSVKKKVKELVTMGKRKKGDWGDFKHVLSGSDDGIGSAMKKAKPEGKPGWLERHYQRLKNRRGVAVWL